MRTYRTPGIYFEPKDAAAPFIGPLRTDVAGFVGLASRGPLHTPVKIESLTQFKTVFGGPMAQAYLAYAVQCFFGNGGATCWIVRAADPATASQASLDIIGDDGRAILRLKAGSPGSWGNNILARWMTRGSRIVSLTLHYPDGSEELIRNPADEIPAGMTMLARDSETLPANLIAPLIALERNATRSFGANEMPLAAGEGRLAGGADGLETLDARHISGEDAPIGVRWGLAALELIDEVSMVAIPDIMPKLRVFPTMQPPPKYDCRVLDQPVQPKPLPQPEPEFAPELDAAVLQEALVRHCEKLHYRVAILDPNDGLLPEGVIAAANPFRTSSFAALYYPWIEVDDPLRLTGLVRSIPPSGAVAGVYARSDRLYGVHKPPANEILQGALNVRFLVDEVIHGELNDAGVNVVRPFSGRGIRVYGARTTSSDTLWRYVSVRRLISMIEKALDKGSQWTIFEPNSAALRREIDRTVRSFLEALFRKGMLDGADSTAAYTVKCDDATTPAEEVDLGRVVCHVGVQPPYPAEFVVVVIGKTQNAMQILKEGGSIDA
jgi:phage tail sheath protein FI